MRLWLRLAIRLYPAPWRARYGRELDALISDLDPRPHDLWDIFCGAITMHLSTPLTYFKFGAATALAGALVAGGVSFTLPERYVSSAVLRIVPQVPSGSDAAQYQVAAMERLTQLQQDVLSRASLASLIQKPDLNLYVAERQRYPLEDVIERMREQDVRIQSLEPKLPFQSSASVFQISFEYPDRDTAQRVVRSLVAKFVDDNVLASRGVLPKSMPVRPPNEHSPASAPEPAPLPVILEVLDPANLPVRASEPNRLGIAAIGLGAGLALGLLAAFLRCRPLRWTLWIVGTAIVGFFVFFAIAIAADFELVPFAGLGAALAASIAAYALRDRAAWKPAPYVKSALAAAVCGAILAGFASFAAPEHYVSSAVVRTYQRDSQGLLSANTTDAVAFRLHRIRVEMLSRDSLAALIRRPSLDLYRAERQRRPLEEIIQDMRRDIRFQATNPVSGAHTISFEYTDPLKAQAVVREIVANLIETNRMHDRSANRISSAQGSIFVEVIDNASAPDAAVSPDRLRFAEIGFAAGLPLGLVIAFLRRRPPGQGVAMLRFAAATGAAGAVVGALISFAIPSRYVSTATLRVSAADGRDTPDRGALEQIGQRMIEVLSRRSLAELIQRPDLDLYRSERASRPLEEIVAGMRNRDLRIEPLDVGPASGRTTAFSIAFEYPDPEKARAVVQSLISKFVEGRDSPRYLEVIDEPSLPQTPSFPARMLAAGSGLLIGIILGPIAQVLRRRKPYSAAAYPSS
jgi:uncharacterized protein involved in exopolysaccharide biosynthesis